MKHFKNILSTLLLTTLIGTGAFASDFDRDSSVKKQIANHMVHPGDGLEGVVYAHFTVDEEGQILIIGLDSSDEQLETFVKAKLEDMVMKKDITDPGDEHHMHFFFKTDK